MVVYCVLILENNVVSFSGRPFDEQITGCQFLVGILTVKRIKHVMKRILFTS